MVIANSSATTLGLSVLEGDNCAVARPHSSSPPNSTKLEDWVPWLTRARARFLLTTCYACGHPLHPARKCQGTVDDSDVELCACAYDGGRREAVAL